MNRRRWMTAVWASKLPGAVKVTLHAMAYATPSRDRAFTTTRRIATGCARNGSR